ncbi:MAG: metallophosphoesterase family protein [Candidatus Binataceae bacterium]
MNKPIDRRSFLRVTGTSLGIGALYTVGSALAGNSMAGTMVKRVLHASNGEAPGSFSFAQLSDTHVGFNGPPDPLGTQAFKRAVAMVNRMVPPPELVIFTGDLTHDAEQADVHAARMRTFKSIAGELKVPALRWVPGENDAALDGGRLYREHFGETHYSFDHRGLHFVALDNVSRGRPEVGTEQLAWLKRDLARYPVSTPIVVFTHRPLFDLKPEWEWFTSDGDEVMEVLAAYENVTVLYGHIHRRNFHEDGHARHYAARSLIFAFPDPSQAGDRKPLAFDANHPFENLGIRQIAAGGPALAINDVELSRREFSGTCGIQQLAKSGVIA